jgi:sulfoxide reductase heme-binding subunit YedZ
VYLIACLAILHYWFHKLAKNNIAEPAVYAAILGLLLGVRLVHWHNARHA